MEFKDLIEVRRSVRKYVASWKNTEVTRKPVSEVVKVS